MDIRTRILCKSPMKTDYMLKGQQRSLAKPRACLATERDRAIASVKKVITVAGSSDNLNADLKEGFVQSLKKALAKLQQLNPDILFVTGALSVLAQLMISMSQRISMSQGR